MLKVTFTQYPYRRLSCGDGGYGVPGAGKKGHPTKRIVLTECDLYASWVVWIEQGHFSLFDDIHTIGKLLLMEKCMSSVMLLGKHARGNSFCILGRKLLKKRNPVDMLERIGERLLLLFQGNRRGDSVTLLHAVD